MQNYEEDSIGATALNWAVIAGAAILLMASLLAVVPVQALHQSAPAHTAEATDDSNRTS